MVVIEKTEDERAGRSARILRLILALQSHNAKPLQCFHYNARRKLLALAFKNDKKVLVWSVDAAEFYPRYKLACVLLHRRNIRDLAWLSRQSGKGIAGDEDTGTLLTRTSDMRIRTWKTVVDEPTSLSPAESDLSDGLDVVMTNGTDLPAICYALRWGASDVVLRAFITLSCAIDEDVPVAFGIQAFQQEQKRFRMCSPQNMAGLDDAFIRQMQRFLTQATPQEHVVQTLSTLLRATIDINNLGDRIDVNGQRYIAERAITLINSPARSNSLALGRDSLCILLASFSETQNRLLTYVIENNGGSNSIRWPTVKVHGIFLWCDSVERLRSLAEKLARTEYARDEQKDPTWSSLIYLALGKLKIVEQLWRQAVWHPEHQKMLRFLQNNFSEQRWRAAAQKNAFALLSQRRFRLAILFFLLSGNLEEAVGVCLRSLNDEHLAIALCRVWHKVEDGALTLQSVAEGHILRKAIEDQDRYKVAWAAELVCDYRLAATVISGIPHISRSPTPFDEAATLHNLTTDRRSLSDQEVDTCLMLVTSRRFKETICRHLPQDFFKPQILSLLELAGHSRASKLRSYGLHDFASTIENFVMPSGETERLPLPKPSKEATISTKRVLRRQPQVETSGFDFSAFDL